MWPVLLATLLIFFFVMIIMGIGYLASGRCLRGSCGGVVGDDGQISCPTCGKSEDESGESTNNGGR